jgi:hypothetical protein
MDIFMKKMLFMYLLFILIGVSACTQGVSVTSIPTLSSGIEMHVTQEPICPGPIRAGDTSCQDGPFQAIITVLDANNNQITQFKTDVDGYFKIPLSPGSYILHPESGIPLPTARDQTVFVTAGQFTQVLIQYDTGIR